MMTDDIAAALYHAVDKNDVTKLRHLIQEGADPNENYNDSPALSFTILHLCCGKGHLEAAKVLVEAGANVQSRDVWAMTPFIHSIISQYKDVVEYLLTVCPQLVNQPDKFDKSPLHFAIESDNVDIFELLIKWGADINRSTMYGITPLMFACITPKLSNREDMVRILIEEGALVDLKDFLDYRTALQFAVTKRHTDIVSVLLSAGADSNSLDKGGSTPLTNLMASSIRATCLDPPVGDDVMTIIVLLQQKGAELNTNKCEYSNPLMVSTLLKSATLVEYFLGCGANPNVKFVSGISPLLAAVGNRDLNTTRLLLRHNADVSAKAMVCRRRQEERLFDPFELAVDLLQWDIVDILIHYGYSLSQHKYLQDSLYSETAPESLRDHLSVLTKLQTLASSPFSLQKIVVLKIRHILKYEISEKVKDLPLPASLKMALLFLENL
ncbi:serine/threonine-protein phosphatase 6 regulatory ankyrin repeat subunit C-like [Saccostrea echinata]|uniref:serine/threonine-protein phosphatase 6 regulatory ankyrin repeat subunit C-like n=1 Tax=Saccostrea echinata TaxID=191078 RepID=UPI002A826BCF|nr:serine/threonine-protein phosphatase 6 regulatory ankyrin repeat subunit C-like [Saccostrea echinata]